MWQKISENCQYEGHNRERKFGEIAFLSNYVSLFSLTSQAIQVLTQVGHDIYLEAYNGILTLSTFNASLTNYATVLFFRNFFTSYQIDVTSDVPEKIVVPSQTMLKPYRTLKVAKRYSSSEIKFNPNEDFITVKSQGKTHVSTTYKLGATQSLSDIEFDCDPDDLKNILKAGPKVLSSCLSNFNPLKGLSELTLKIQGQRVMLKNTVTDFARSDGIVVTEYNLTLQDFTEFKVDDDVESIELAFGFREFKLFTSFAEHLKLPVSIHFQTPVEPVIVTVKTDTFEARLCMATRIRDPLDLPGTGASGSSMGGDGRISNVPSQRPGSSHDASVEVNRRVESVILDCQRAECESSVLEEPAGMRTGFEFESSLNRDDDDVMIRDEPGTSLNPMFEIEPLVQQMEKRAKSVGYLTLQAVVNAPPMTEEKYLKLQPGHDQVLCPESDEEDAT